MRILPRVVRLIHVKPSYSVWTKEKSSPFVLLKKHNSFKHSNESTITYNWCLNEANLTFCIYLVVHHKPNSKSKSLVHNLHNMSSNVTSSVKKPFELKQSLVPKLTIWFLAELFKWDKNWFIYSAFYLYMTDILEYCYIWKWFKWCD